MSPQRFRLLVFDWDGTLIDSIGAIVECAQVTFAELGLPPLAEATIRGAIGLGIRETVNRFLPDCTDSDFDRIVEVYRRHWFSDYRRRPALVPGARQALERLARESYWLAVATAKGRAGLRLDLEATRLAPLFHTTRTVDEARSKPHPEMLLGILDELGVPAEAALMIGDTVHDLQMAANAGVAGVGVLTGSLGRAALERRAPVACLASVAELPDWLAERSG